MFFELSKIFWFIAAPGNALFVLMVLSAMLLWSPWVRTGRALTSIAVLVGCIVAIFPMGSWINWHLENRFPAMRNLPQHVDGIIVAGGIIDPGTSHARGQPVIGGAVERLTAASSLALQFPDAQIIFSGGSGDLLNQDLKEADYVAPFFIQMGIPAERVIFENQARNTVENAKITYKIANPRPEETWVLVTSAFHMPRAMGTFRKAGWSILAYPTDYGSRPQFNWHFGFNYFGNMGKLNGAVHEILGLIFYRLTGKSDAFFPEP